MMIKMKELFINEQGYELTEYGRLLGIIAVAVVGILALLRNEILEMFSAVTNYIATR